MLDMRTIVFSFVLSNLICMLFMAVLWKQNHRRFAGIEFWVADFILQFLGLILIALRYVVPDILSMTVSNAMIIGGTVLIYEGFEKFLGQRRFRLHNYLLLAVFIVIHLYFVLVLPDLIARSLLFSLALSAICIQCAWLLLKRVSPEMRAVTRGVGYVFVAFILISIARIVVDVVVHPADDFMHSNIFEAAVLTTYQILFIVLTFSLFLMVNSRLFTEMEKDFTARQIAEAALRLSEEKFSKAFQSSTDAILISRVSDGVLIEINDGFTRLTGYSRTEALNTSSFALSLWANTEDRTMIIKSLKEKSRITDRRIDLRAKSGKILNCLYSGEIINLAGGDCILSMVRDVSVQELAEKILRLRLILWEYSAAHSVKELMQMALDEIEKLTDSVISFYHFVQQEQGTLTLQVWSTRTKAVFCKAEGEGMHYSIADAGVWADCVNTREPVIHNDYASLPHRKGMPPGHAEVVRELVVPIMREGRIVSILGVGNKPIDYDDKDIHIVAYIADLLWTIVSQKRANEQIERLNRQLERQAMTDHLTKLANRRAFFKKGGDEIKKSHRYQAPLALIMLDIDNFKKVNDNFGHDEGDAVLRRIADILNANVREVDMAARLGGEEFGILLPSTKTADAVILAERLRRAIEEEGFSELNHKPRMTVSIGVATSSADMPGLEALLKQADIAMYEAKRRGRNRVVSLDDG
jgi:diguanylate cyclase (GGDEF)-like protein/PAS domain S-box-containing protein